jgi:SAM-dependent methyltransferase
MNLVEMFRRKDKNLKISGDLSVEKFRFEGVTYRGIVFPTAAALLIRSPLDFYPFCEFPAYVGWFAKSPTPGSVLTITYSAADEMPIVLPVNLTESLQAIKIPYPIYQQANPAEGWLTLRCVSGNADFIVGQINDRSRLIALCQGKGVEIGPGHQPQIFPSESVDVVYLEEKTRDEWISSYMSHGEAHADHGHWDRYITGNASKMPVDDKSLDFIFASHLFEHLANPIGHLQYWATKLKTGGKIVCVIPDMAGTKDYVYRPSQLAEWLEELNEEVWAPTLKHFERFAEGRGKLQNAQEMMSQAISVHVHFYTPSNVATLLDFCVKKRWFSTYRIDHLPNNKDFYFWIQA